MGFNCLSCTQCCKRYNISLLPEEAETIAKALGISLQEFFEQYTQLFVQLFPSSFKKEKLVVSSASFPKELQKQLIETNSSHFLVLPGIILKRNNESCVFLKNNLCSIHETKPEPCNLFPFISWNPEQDLRKSYKFCSGLRASKEQVTMQEHHILAHEKHYEKVKQNFEQIKKQGFKNLYSNLPSSGKLLIKNKFVSNISKKEFEQIIGLTK